MLKHAHVLLNELTVGIGLLIINTDDVDLRPSEKVSIGSN